jgi:PIF1 helicase.
MVVLAGDFQQNLPVIPPGTKADELQHALHHLINGYM